MYVIGYRRTQFMRRASTFQRMWQPANSPFVCSTQDGEHMYSHPQIDCFVVSQLFSEAKPASYFKPRSKPS